MFIGHLPAAYLALKPFQRHLPPMAFGAALVGSVLPDVDMLWFYLVDDRAHHHHAYLTHRPVLWMQLWLLGMLLRRFAPRLGIIMAMLATGALIHMLLDSIAGAIHWGWPVAGAPITLVEVQPTHDHWIKSFLSHWTFKVEIAICLLAALVWWRSRAQRRRPV